MNTTKKEVQLLDIQTIATVIYIASLVLSIFLTRNNRNNLTKDQKIFSDKQSINLSIFNRVSVFLLTLTFLFINYESLKIAKQKGKKLDAFSLQLFASLLTTSATIIVLYVVIKTAGEQYTIISGGENPTL
jgi:uncharacterized membrane protein YbhN (UPF0104 family)